MFILYLPTGNNFFFFFFQCDVGSRQVFLECSASCNIQLLCNLCCYLPCSAADVLFFACHHLESMTLQPSKVDGLVDAVLLRQIVGRLATASSASDSTCTVDAVRHINGSVCMYVYVGYVACHAEYSLCYSICQFSSASSQQDFFVCCVVQICDV